MIYNIFCDASIDIQNKIACGGCYITRQIYSGNMIDVGYKRVIQLNATNNSSEILAIEVGVEEALRIRKTYPDSVFRLFSDSSISLLGLRDWISNWIQNMNEDGTLIASNNQPVKNQQKFIDIYNCIVSEHLQIQLFHQRGHVKETVSLEEARKKFITMNKLTPESLGTTIEELSKYNRKIDNLTRDAISIYETTNKLPEFTTFELQNAMNFGIMKEALPLYKRLISK